MSPQTDIVLPCIGGVLAEILGSRVLLGSLGPPPWILAAPAAPENRRDPGRGADFFCGHGQWAPQARGRHREICDGLCWSRWVLRGLGARGMRCIDVPGPLRRCSTWWPGSGARRTTYSRSWVSNVAATAPMGYCLLPTPDARSPPSTKVVTLVSTAVEQATN